MNQEKIGNFIRELRIKRGMSQKDLAKDLCVSVAAISKWENGRNLPDISNLNAIAEIFQVSLTEILNGEVVLVSPPAANVSTKMHNHNHSCYIKLVSMFSVVLCLLIGFSIWYLQNTSPEFIVVNSYYDKPEEVFDSLNFNQIYRVIVQYKGKATDTEISQFYQRITSEIEATQDLSETDAIFIEYYKNYQQISTHDFDYFYMQITN